MPPRDDASDRLVFGRLLSVQRPALCPEIALWLVDGAVDLNAHCDELMRGGYAPYWAFCWSAGQALSRYILDHPDEVRGRSVVDFGTGSGVVAIAARLAGAREVLAVDNDPRALERCAINAALNGVSVTPQPELPAAWDVLLAADVLYELSMLAFLEERATLGRSVLVSDPRRPGHPRVTSEAIAHYEARCLPDVDAPVASAFIHRLR